MEKGGGREVRFSALLDETTPHKLTEEGKCPYRKKGRGARVFTEDSKNHIWLQCAQKRYVTSHIIIGYFPVFTVKTDNEDQQVVDVICSGFLSIYSKLLDSVIY